MNILQQKPSRVTVVKLLVQRILVIAAIAAVTGLIAAVQENPELFGGSTLAMLLYLLLTSVKDWLNPYIPNK